MTHESKIDELFDAWEGGFAAWARPARAETLRDLDHGDLDDLAREVTYAVREYEHSRGRSRPDRDALRDAAKAWLRDHRSELLREVRAS